MPIVNLPPLLNYSHCHDTQFPFLWRERVQSERLAWLFWHSHVSCQSTRSYSLLMEGCCSVSHMIQCHRQIMLEYAAVTSACCMESLEVLHITWKIVLENGFFLAVGSNLSLLMPVGWKYTQGKYWYIKENSYVKSGLFILNVISFHSTHNSIVLWRLHQRFLMLYIWKKSLAPVARQVAEHGIDPASGFDADFWCSVYEVHTFPV